MRPVTRRLAAMCALAVFILGVASRSISAQNSDVMTLRDSSAIAVVVQDLPDGAKVLDLSEDTIQTDVELKLRLAGVRVVAKKEVSQLPGRPHLYLRVTLTSDAQAASIEVQLRQNILLERNGDSAIGVTWLETTLFSHPTSEAIRNAVKDNVDKFLNS
jgi:hypothetical protein